VYGGWSRGGESVALIGMAGAVFGFYVVLLARTIRQIFYRLVGADGYEKTEQAYKRLGELLNKARRARLIDMDAIRDDGFSSQLTTFFANAEAFINNAIAWAEELRLDRQLVFCAMLRRLLMATSPQAKRASCRNLPSCPRTASRVRCR
jgi:hypothetical protein